MPLSRTNRSLPDGLCHIIIAVTTLLFKNPKSKYTTPYGCQREIQEVTPVLLFFSEGRFTFRQTLGSPKQHPEI